MDGNRTNTAHTGSACSGVQGDIHTGTFAGGQHCSETDICYNPHSRGWSLLLSSTHFLLTALMFLPVHLFPLSMANKLQWYVAGGLSGCVWCLGLPKERHWQAFTSFFLCLNASSSTFVTSFLGNYTTVVCSRGNIGMRRKEICLGLFEEWCWQAFTSFSPFKFFFQFICLQVPWQIHYGQK